MIETATLADPAPTASDPTNVCLRIAAKDAVAEDVVAVTLSHPNGGRLPDWTPGSHIDLMLPNGDVRQYSLCGDRWDPSSYRVAVLREPAGRGGSAFVHDELAVGDMVAVGGPRNHFPLVPSERYLFIAGGIGITPLLPMIDQAVRLDADWTLLYGGRKRASMAFLDDLAQHDNRVHVVPQDTDGLLDLDHRLRTVDRDTKVYCCGPAPLLDAVQTACGHLPPHALRTERFVAKPRTDPIRHAPFVVTLDKSGIDVTVTPEMSVLEAVRSAGVSVLSSCREGTCGTCETTVLDGRPDHRDSILDDDEREGADCMFVCVSRSCTDRLVLDL
jgi:ferredoxin-NADP reductase